MNYDELDPGIRETVRWLQSLGYDTTDSGDGVTKRPADCACEWTPGNSDCSWCIESGIYTCWLPMPNVAIVLDRESDGAAEADRLAMRLRARGIELDASGAGPRIEFTYSPNDGVKLLVLLNVDDNTLPRLN